MAFRRTEAPPPERTFWELLPRRNLRRVIFLVAVLVAVIVLQRSGGLPFRKLLDDMAPLAPSASGPGNDDKTSAGRQTFSPMKVVTPAARPAAGAGGAPP